jgi:hypothetical protein
LLTRLDTREYAYKISAAGWHSCALVAIVEKDSTLSAGGIPQFVDGCLDSKVNVSGQTDGEQAPADENQTQLDPKSLPKTEKGHRGGIVGMQSDARGMQGGLTQETMTKGGQSAFGALGHPGPSNARSTLGGPPKSERGHRGGIVGTESDARGGTGGLAEGTMTRGGNSFFGLTGGPLQLGKDDKLSESRQKAEKQDEEGGEGSGP